MVNERAVRATAGIMFLIGISAFWYIRLTKDYTIMNIVVPLFWLDFLIKAVLTPRWSIFGVVGKFLVRKQKPEYVGAIQKRFAWFLGLTLASAMMIVGVFLEIRGLAPLLICGTCLTFMWLETACGICVGCKIYTHLQKRGILAKPEYNPACPGGVCRIDKN